MTSEVVPKKVMRKHLRTVLKKKAVTTSEVVQVPKVITENKTEWETKTRDVKRSRMVKSQVSRPQTTWETRTHHETAWRDVNRTVMTSKTVATQVQTPSNCSCYQSNCGCVGQWNCGCCYPTCGCAPQTTTQYHTVQVPTTVTTREQYTKPVIRSVPVTTNVLVDTWSPQEYTETETYKSPKVVQVQRTI